MKVFYDPEFLTKLKNVDVRIRHRVKDRMLIFSKNHHDPQLNNHSLKREYQGYRSINITADFRALYKEVDIGDEKVAYFVLLGTHTELYKP
ncbi:MAG: type II toxin-antitoxin system mRNA interferase toxin, RelE/StbE family [Patescibacteria group bacterium]